MEEQFVAYEMALKLKELGFNEPCFGFWDKPYDKWTLTLQYPNELDYGYINKYDNIKVSAPLWQQVVDWLRIKRNIHIEITRHENGWGSYLSKEKFGERFVKGYYAKIPFFYIDNIEVDCSFRSYEVAREEAILQAIELCQKKD